MPALISLAAKILLLTAILSGSVRLDRPLYAGGTDDVYQYDDGTAWWITWEGLYRGVWFDSEDFGIYYNPCIVDLEFWFYHHTSYPWDTGSFYAELYNGEQEGPVTQLDQTSLTAVHYAPCYADYSSPIVTAVNFWGLVNTEMSSGGWPSLLSDNSPNWTGNDHSFYSDDFVVWDPWIAGGIGLEAATWGGVKALYGSNPLGIPESCDYFIRFMMNYGPLAAPFRE